MRKFISRAGDSTWQDGADENGNSFTKKVLMGREYSETFAGGKFGIVGVDGKEIFAPIYDHFGLPHTEAIDQGVRDYLAENPRDKHGLHSYSIEDFGLTRAEVGHAFADYNDRFKVAMED